jgi:hypothetical protein
MCGSECNKTGQTRNNLDLFKCSVKTELNLIPRRKALG